MKNKLRQAKHYGITFKGIVYDIREYIDKEKKIIKKKLSDVSNVINLGSLQIIVNNQKGVLDATI